jgi:hypothetical protein
MVVVKTKGNKLIAGPTQIARLPKAGRTTLILPAVGATTLSSAQPGTVLNNLVDVGVSQPWLEVGDNSASYGITRAALDFGQLGQVPAKAKIVDSYLKLWQETTSSNSKTGAVYELHGLTSSFTNSQATWNNANSTTAWTTKGGDFSTDPAESAFCAVDLARGHLRVGAGHDLNGIEASSSRIQHAREPTGPARLDGPDHVRRQTPRALQEPELGLGFEKIRQRVLVRRAGQLACEGQQAVGGHLQAVECEPCRRREQTCIRADHKRAIEQPVPVHEVLGVSNTPVDSSGEPTDPLGIGVVSKPLGYAIDLLCCEQMVDVPPGRVQFVGADDAVPGGGKLGGGPDGAEVVKLLRHALQRDERDVIDAESQSRDKPVVGHLCVASDVVDDLLRVLRPAGMNRPQHPVPQHVDMHSWRERD